MQTPAKRESGVITISNDGTKKPVSLKKVVKSRPLFTIKSKNLSDWISQIMANNVTSVPNAGFKRSKKK